MRSKLPKSEKTISQMKPKDQVKELLVKHSHTIREALPKHVNAERLLRVAQTAVTSSPKLLECYAPSLLGGIVQCSQMGLEPNTVMGHADLIPFWNSKKNRREAQVIVGYKGYIDLARRSGQIISIAAHAVYERDEFEFVYGLDERLSHKPALYHRGRIIAFYAIAHLKDGGHAFEVMSREEIEKIRDQHGKGNAVWSDHFEQMGRKTVIRRLAKFLPLSIELATAVSMDDASANHGSQNLESVMEGEYSPIYDNSDDQDNPPPEWSEMNDTIINQGIRMDNNGNPVSPSGEVFNREIHGLSNGKPIVNKDGSFKRRRGTMSKKRMNDPHPAPTTHKEEAAIDEPVQGRSAKTARRSDDSTIASNYQYSEKQERRPIELDKNTTENYPMTQGQVLKAIDDVTTLDEWTKADRMIERIKDPAQWDLPKLESRKKWQEIMSKKEL